MCSRNGHQCTLTEHYGEVKGEVLNTNLISLPFLHRLQSADPVFHLLPALRTQHQLTEWSDNLGERARDIK